VTTFLPLGLLFETGFAVADFLGTTLGVGVGAACFLVAAEATSEKKIISFLPALYRYIHKYRYNKYR
jgi:hypothetical protein